jgi:C4-dicarboxylate-specific signal transduction histidine kinase
MSEDIIETLRRFARGAQEQNATDAVSGLLAAAEEIERLRAERDEARREVCQKHDHGYFFHEDYAEIRGWDCFKEVSR